MGKTSAATQPNRRQCSPIDARPSHDSQPFRWPNSPEHSQGSPRGALHHPKVRPTQEPTLPTARLYDPPGSVQWARRLPPPTPRHTQPRARPGFAGSPRMRSLKNFIDPKQKGASGVGFKLTACHRWVIQKERCWFGGGGTAAQGLRAVWGEVPRPHSHGGCRWNPEPHPWGSELQREQPLALPAPSPPSRSLQRGPLHLQAEPGLCGGSARLRAHDGLCERGGGLCWGGDPRAGQGGWEERAGGAGTAVGSRDRPGLAGEVTAHSAHTTQPLCVRLRSERRRLRWGGGNAATPCGAHPPRQRHKAHPAPL